MRIIYSPQTIYHWTRNNYFPRDIWDPLALLYCLYQLHTHIDRETRFIRLYTHETFFRIPHSCIELLMLKKYIFLL